VTSLTAVSGPRPSRPDGGRQRHGGRPAAAGPQHREGRPGKSFLPREECAQRAQGKKVADRALRDRGRRATASASRRLIRQQQAAKERWSLSRQGEAWFRRLRLRDDRLTHPPARSQRRKACSARVIEREDRTGGSAGHSEMPRRRGPEEHPLLVRPGGGTPVYPPALGAAGSRDRPSLRRFAPAMRARLRLSTVRSRHICRASFDLLVQFPLMLQPAGDGSEPIVSGPGRHSHNLHQRLPFPIRVADDDAPVIMPPGSAR
jgi:hypothetical protein